MTRQNATGRRIHSSYPQQVAPRGEAAQVAAIVIAPSAEKPAVAKESRVPAFLRDLPHWEPTRP
jgi:hypothetical protein